jgi:hypothetical protein
MRIASFAVSASVLAVALAVANGAVVYECDIDGPTAPPTYAADSDCWGSAWVTELSRNTTTGRLTTETGISNDGLDTHGALSCGDGTECADSGTITWSPGSSSTPPTTDGAFACVAHATCTPSGSATSAVTLASFTGIYNLRAKFREIRINGNVFTDGNPPPPGHSFGSTNQVQNDNENFTETRGATFNPVPCGIGWEVNDPLPTFSFTMDFTAEMEWFAANQACTEFVHSEHSVTAELKITTDQQLTKPMFAPQ